MARHLAGPRGAFGSVFAALLVLSLAGAVRADDQATKAQPGQKGGAGQNAPPAAEQHRLPPDSATKHTLALPGRTLSFTAMAGSIRVFDDKGEPQADVAYTSYQRDDGGGEA